MAYILNREPQEGTELRDFSLSSGMQQLVTQRTQGHNLLDLVIIDLGDISTSVTCVIADHRGVIADLSIPMPKEPVYSGLIPGHPFRDVKGFRV